MQRLVPFFGQDSVNNRADNSIPLALRIQIVGYLLTFGDQRKMVGENTGKALDLIVRQMCL